MRENNGYILHEVEAAHPLVYRHDQVSDTFYAREEWLILWQANGYAPWVLRANRMVARIHHINGDRADNRPGNFNLRWP